VPPLDGIAVDGGTGRLSPAEFGIEVLRRAEADPALFEPSVGGFALWPVFRFPAWQLVSGVLTGAASGRWRLLRRAARASGVLTYGAWSLLQSRRLRARRFDFLFLTLEAHRSVERPDGWWDPYLDDVAAHPSLAGRVLRVEGRDRVVSRRRTPAARHLFTDLQRFSRGRARGGGDARGALRASEQTCDLLFDHLRRSGAAVDPARERAFRVRCAGAARRFLGERAGYERLLEDFRPAAVALVDAYNQHGLVAAARARGIPAVEFQHGNIHPDHPGYIWFAGAAAVRGRLPIPDRIATYGAYWSEVLAREGFWAPAEVPAVGSARMDATRRMPRERGEGSVLRIVFTSQFATRDHAIPLLDEFLRLAEEAGLDYTLAIKVHRAEREFMAGYRALAKRSPRVSVLAPYERDTLELIAGADVHVSGWSTCHYEAVGLGTPTVVLIFPGPDRVQGLDAFSSVFRASSAAELMERLSSIPDARRVQSEAWREESERLFRRGAVDHAAALLEACARR
jgi:hypothetical protein